MIKWQFVLFAKAWIVECGNFSDESNKLTISLVGLIPRGGFTGGAVDIFFFQSIPIVLTRKRQKTFITHISDQTTQTGFAIPQVAARGGTVGLSTVTWPDRRIALSNFVLSLFAFIIVLYKVFCNNVIITGEKCDWWNEWIFVMFEGACIVGCLRFYRHCGTEKWRERQKIDSRSLW